MRHARAGQEQQGDLPHHAVEESQGLRSLPTRAGVLGNDDIVRLGSELFGALCEAQNEIGSDFELALLEFLQATVNRIRIPVYEKHAKRTASMRTSSFRTQTPPGSLEFVLSQV
jgi:hypothetical protein